MKRSNSPGGPRRSTSSKSSPPSTPVNWMPPTAAQRRMISRTTGLTPNAAWDKALEEKRSHLLPVPAPPLLDLHLALYHQRRLNTDGTLDFLGQNWPVTTLRQKTVTLVHHPEQGFWVIPQTPDPKHPLWPAVLAHHRL